MSNDIVEIQSVSEDVERLRRERPYTRPFVDPFVGLLLARPTLVHQLVEEARRQPCGELDLSRLGLGAPLEPRDAFPLDEGGIRRVFEVLHPVLSQGFPSVRSDLANIGLAVTRKEGFLLEVVRDVLGDRQKALFTTAYALGVEARTLVFWCIQMLTPLAMARGRLLGALVPEGIWNRGYCPVCGSWPSVTRRHGIDQDMTCAYCSTTWRFTYQQCPFCDASGPSGQAYAMPGHDTERVVVCQRCNHFLGEITGDPFPGMSPEVEALALAPLEILARQHGHTPATMDWRQMLWMQ